MQYTKLEVNATSMSMVKKATKFFLDLEKHREIQSQIHSVIINQDVITDQTDINKMFSFLSLFISR